MENYRKTTHSIYDIKYHIVWITKYRKPAITGKVAERTREVIRQVCQNNDVEILAGHVSKDHVHLLVSVWRAVPDDGHACRTHEYPL